MELAHVKPQGDREGVGGTPKGTIRGSRGCVKMKCVTPSLCFSLMASQTDNVFAALAGDVAAPKRPNKRQQRSAKMAASLHMSMFSQKKGRESVQRTQNKRRVQNLCKGLRALIAKKRGSASRTVVARTVVAPKPVEIEEMLDLSGPVLGNPVAAPTPVAAGPTWASLAAAGKDELLAANAKCKRDPTPAERYQMYMAEKRRNRMDRAMSTVRRTLATGEDAEADGWDGRELQFTDILAAVARDAIDGDAGRVSKEVASTLPRETRVAAAAQAAAVVNDEDDDDDDDGYDYDGYEEEEEWGDAW